MSQPWCWQLGSRCLRSVWSSVYIESPRKWALTSKESPTTEYADSPVSVCVWGEGKSPLSGLPPGSTPTFRWVFLLQIMWLRKSHTGEPRGLSFSPLQIQSSWQPRLATTFSRILTCLSFLPSSLLISVGELKLHVFMANNMMFLKICIHYGMVKSSN